MMTHLYIRQKALPTKFIDFRLPLQNEKIPDLEIHQAPLSTEPHTTSRPPT